MRAAPAAPASARAAAESLRLAGLVGVNSQVVNSASRSCPETCSASRMNSGVVTVPPPCELAHRRSMRKKSWSPTVSRSWCRVMAPRAYTAKSNSASGPGSPMVSDQNGSSAGMAAV